MPLQTLTSKAILVAKPELGLKRQCMSCGAKFYDLGKDPAVCPKCATVYQAVALSRVAPPAAARKVEEEDEVEADVVGGPELVSLDEVEAAEEDKVLPTDDDDIEVADDDADADTFLEEEEEGDDDVADLIDSDLEDDEEA
jgi:uncharacterized protein (TIGR02300 family)